MNDICKNEQIEDERDDNKEEQKIWDKIKENTRVALRVLIHFIFFAYEPSNPFITF